MEVMNPLGRHMVSSATTLVLLLLALATVFLFDGGRGQPGSEPAPPTTTWELGGRGGGVPPDGKRGDLTKDHMTVALNMSSEHGFLGFYGLFRTGDGDLSYRLYNRFPALGHTLIQARHAAFLGRPRRAGDGGANADAGLLRRRGDARLPGLVQVAVSRWSRRAALRKKNGLFHTRGKPLALPG